ncbi:hypothetical protein DMENIID0001_025500 [Sergentomyia squamirostris]
MPNRGNCEEVHGYLNFVWLRLLQKIVACWIGRSYRRLSLQSTSKLEDIILPIIVACIAGYVEHALLDSRLCRGVQESLGRLLKNVGSSSN